MNNFLIIKFYAGKEENTKIIDKIYEILPVKLRELGYEADVKIDDPDGYISVKRKNKSFGITTPQYSFNPVTCGVYFEKKPGTLLEDDEVKKELFPVILEVLDSLIEKSEKIWFSTYDEMLNSINRG